MVRQMMRALETGWCADEAQMAFSMRSVKAPTVSGNDSSVDWHEIEQS